MERRLKANLKHVQQGDELGTRKAKNLSEIQGEQWFDLVKSTVEHENWISSEAYQINLKCLETEAGGDDIGVWAVEIAIRYTLEEAVDAVREWLPENNG